MLRAIAMEEDGVHYYTITSLREWNNGGFRRYTVN